MIRAPFRALAALTLLALLGACGSMKALRPTPGMSTVPVAIGADKPQSAEALITPTTQARPDRQADLLIQSQERPSDPFDLPPGPDNGRPAKSNR